MFQKVKLRSIILPFLLIGICLFSSCADQGATSESSVQTSGPSASATPESPAQHTDGSLTISYLDVGQGDSAFVVLPNGESILIDAGNQSDGESIIEYIRESGITTLDYVVATHPHADHIGGMAQEISDFEVEKVYMPKKAHTSKTFENLLDTIKEKGLSITSAKGEVVLFDYGNLKAEFLEPCSDSYQNLNNYSAVLLLTYGDRRFLFMGDAEAESEAEILARNIDVSADLLKAGHHGSASSSTESFISAVNPCNAVISVGKNNSYGHPGSAVLSILQSTATVWRTDEHGTIIATCDGENITLNHITTSIHPHAPPDVSSDPASDESPDDGQPATVYITESGTKYHRNGCRYLKKSKIAISLSDLERHKYSLCSRCNPPEKKRSQNESSNRQN